MTMFNKILIANRGEIACRVIRTCKKLGIATVAVYSDADAHAQHVRGADEAVHIGASPVAESYLRVDRIIDAIRTTGADAVHPGYGLLSENAQFAEAVADAGATFIGPSPDAIRAMGDKIESKRIAAKAGVSTIPGHPDAIADVDEAVRIAAGIGYPLMVKAAAGGGGKGMRVAADEAELRDGFVRARSEARSSFGDDRVFLERFISDPRHIEIQVLADRHGHVVHLGERECSIQRRHQKVIEEAPSSFIDPPTRSAMGEQAIELARAVGYSSAGTVEFIVDADRKFFFLEMNTRLQVEHPVTELVTGIDLVEQMIRIAANEPLGFGQDDIRQQGWAIEARIYAEDPQRGFLPSIGRLRHYRRPEADGLRIDDGVVEGDEVSMFYDPMIAKVIAHADDRAQAIDRLRGALDRFAIRGIRHNTEFLGAVLHNRRFREGTITTDFIASEFGERFEGRTASTELRHQLAGIAVLLRLLDARRAASHDGCQPGWRYIAERDWVVDLHDEHIDVTADQTAPETARIEIEGQDIEIRLERSVADLRVRAWIDDHPIDVQVDPILEGFRLRHGGVGISAVVRTRRAAELAARMHKKPPRDTSNEVRSPMPGLIVSIDVNVGDAVKLGQDLAVLEAMKMENNLRAERDGTVAEVHIAAGDSVTADQLLITLD